MPSSVTLKFKRHVNAPAAEAFRAFVHATALRDWMCDAAQTDARPGGRLYLWWNDGYAVTGVFTKYEPGKRLAFSWHSPHDPAASLVSVTFTAKGPGTQVALSHGGLGTGAKWRDTVKALDTGWQMGLENLQSIVETGIDLRFARRPRLGIYIGEFSAAIARQLGVPAKAGVRLEGTADGSGAQAAGLQKDDVLVSFNGRKLAGPESIQLAVQGLQAGDKPKVVFYRGGQKHTLALELSRFPIPELPATGPELAGQVRKLQAEVSAAIGQTVAGLSAAQAARRPAENEWSVLELIAHFILSERDLQGWLADMLNDVVIEDWLQMRPNVNARLGALVQRFGTVAALCEEHARAAAETADLLEALPESFVQHRRHLYRRAAQWALEVTPGHWHGEHAEQMQRTIAAARSA